MLGRVVVENGVKKIVPLTADCGSGNPVGTVIAVYSNKVPNGYLPCNGVAFDTAQFPVLYALLGDNHTPDLRECTLKGIGESGRTVGAHVKVGGLAVGEFVDDRVQDFRLRTTEGAGGDGDRLAMGNITGTQGIPRIYTLSTNVRNGDTTEVKAVGVNFCIKATSGINENQADNVLSALSPVNTVASGDMHAVTSNATASAIEALRLGVKSSELSSEGWYKVCTSDVHTEGFAITMYLSSHYNYMFSSSHCISIAYGWLDAHISEVCNDVGTVFDKLMITYEENQVNNIFVHYRLNSYNRVDVKVIGGIAGAYASEVNFEPTDVSSFTDYKIINLGTNGAYVDGVKATCLKEKQIRIDDSTGYSLQDGVYVKTISNFFTDNDIDYTKVVNIRQVNNDNYLYPYFFISYGLSDSLKVFKFANINNTYVDIKVYYYG